MPNTQDSMFDRGQEPMRRQSGNDPIKGNPPDYGVTVSTEKTSKEGIIKYVVVVMTWSKFSGGQTAVG